MIPITLNAAVKHPSSAPPVNRRAHSIKHHNRIIKLLLRLEKKKNSASHVKADIPMKFAPSFPPNKSKHLHMVTWNRHAARTVAEKMECYTAGLTIWDLLEKLNRLLLTTPEGAGVEVQKGESK
ncbi:hypothetical protein Tco_1346107 [Tanacetum coccineum]